VLKSLAMLPDGLFFTLVLLREAQEWFNHC
jgi:hypothetical protein